MVNICTTSHNIQQEGEMYVQVNIEARSLNNCCHVFTCVCMYVRTFVLVSWRVILYAVFLRAHM
jgi:hypothetical protein